MLSWALKQIDMSLSSVTMFVGNLPHNMEDKKVKKLFEKKGIAVAELRRPRKTYVHHRESEGSL